MGTELQKNKPNFFIMDQQKLKMKKLKFKFARSWQTWLESGDKWTRIENLLIDQRILNNWFKWWESSKGPLSSALLRALEHLITIQHLWNSLSYGLPKRTIWCCWTLKLLKIGLEEIEKLYKVPNRYQKLTLETWNWKVMKNIWSLEHILFSKRIDFQAKSQSKKRWTTRQNDP